MATPTTRLKLKKQALSENLNTWGLSNGINGVIDQVDVLAGYLEVDLGTSTSYTFGTTNYSVAGNEHMYRAVKFTGTPASGVTVNIPAVDDFKFVENATGQTITFSNGSTTASLADTFTGYVRTDGSSSITVLVLPDGVNVKTVADDIGNVNLVAGQISPTNNIGTVAGLSSEITLLGTADAVADMNTLGHADVVSDMNALAVADVISDMNTLAVPDVINDMNTLASPDIVSDLNTLATPDIVADMNALAVTDVLADMAALAETDVLADMALLADADVIADMNTLATADIVNDMNLLADADVISDMNTLANADVISDMNTLATADIVADMNTLAHADVVSDMNTLATADIVNDMNVLGTASNVTDMATLADIQDGTVATNAITIAATNSDNITDYSKTYLGPKNSAPTQRNDGTALQSGDLVFRSDLDQMQVRNAANNAWSAVAVTASNFLTVSNNLSDLASASPARTNLGLATVANTGDYSDLSNQPTHLMITGGSAGTIPYQTGANVTAMLAAGVAGQVLSSNGTSAPTWVNQSTGGGVATQMKFA